MHPFGRSLLDLFFPPRCQVCRTFGPEPLCADCRREILLVQAPVCRQCGAALDPQATGPTECSECRSAAGRHPMTWARSAGLYDGSLRKAILALKFLGRRSLAPPLAELLADAVISLGDGVGLDVACPVPLHPTRLKERGFNQSELLARYACERMRLAMDAALLCRMRPTIPQVALPRGERDKNVRGAFALTEGKDVRGARVLLIDDIYTTGSTLKECARVLRKAGAAEVYVLTLARPRPGWMAQK